MKRLTYTKVINSAIEIDLFNGFSTIAVVLTSSDKTTQVVSFYLKNNNTSVIIPIDEESEVNFVIEQNKLYPEILKYVSKLLNNETFEKHIEKYNQDVIKYFYDFHKTIDVIDGE